jgi:hypothetical protein
LVSQKHEDSDRDEIEDAVDFFHQELEQELQKQRQMNPIHHNSQMLAGSHQHGRRQQPFPPGPGRPEEEEEQRPQQLAGGSSPMSSIPSQSKKSPKKVTIVEFNDSSLSEEVLDSFPLHEENDANNNMTAELDEHEQRVPTGDQNQGKIMRTF